MFLYETNTEIHLKSLEKEFSFVSYLFLPNSNRQPDNAGM